MPCISTKPDLAEGGGSSRAQARQIFHSFGTSDIITQCLPRLYAYGSQVTLAVISLVPQVANARWPEAPLDKFSKVVAVDSVCLKLAAFDKARPENQSDAE